MPTIMSLEGPNLALVPRPAQSLALMGPIDMMTSHPIVTFVLGAFVGGFVFSRFTAHGSAWGESHAAHERTKAMHGARHRRSSRRR